MKKSENKTVPIAERGDGDNGWNLTEFSRIIAEQGEQRRNAEDETLRLMREAFPGQVEFMRTMSNADLLTAYRHYGQQGRADPRQTEVYLQMSDEAGKILLERLEQR